jgi:ubiquinone/menaquinone biosynthesis C-methylase UbiE
MTASTPSVSYVLGDADLEHERLIRQAAIFNPFTERLFRDAGIGPGQRILDIGSGVGDVAMLAAKMVGATGEVVGVERDVSTLAKARSRVAEARLPNVSFMELDVADVMSDEPFDAVIGRLILQFLPNPGAVVRSLSTLVRPGGVIAFQECYWGPLLQLTAHLPLRSRPRMEQRSLSFDGVGDLESLMTRLEAELVGTKTVPACIGLVGAWSQRPTSTQLL